MREVRPAYHRCNLPGMVSGGEILQCEECHTYWKGYVYRNPYFNCWRKVGLFERWRLGLK